MSVPAGFPHPMGVRAMATQLLLAMDRLGGEMTGAHPVLLRLDHEMAGLRMALEHTCYVVGPQAPELEQAQRALRGLELPRGAPAGSISISEEVSFLDMVRKLPIFATASIEYEPSAVLLDEHGLLLYLWSFRALAQRADEVAGRIADDVMEAISPIGVKVIITQRSSPLAGTVALQAYAERGGR